LPYNPLLGEKVSAFGTEKVTAQNQMKELQRLVHDAPAGVPALDTVKQMVDAYDTYHKSVADLGSTSYDDAVRKSVGSQYRDWMMQTAASNPQVQALYTGVFRTLDSQVLDPLPTTTAEGE
jgi:hypothetical protein